MFALKFSESILFSPVLRITLDSLLSHTHTWYVGQSCLLCLQIAAPFHSLLWVLTLWSGPHYPLPGLLVSFFQACPRSIVCSSLRSQSDLLSRSQTAHPCPGSSGGLTSHTENKPESWLWPPRPNTTWFLITSITSCLPAPCSAATWTHRMLSPEVPAWAVSSQSCSPFSTRVPGRSPHFPQVFV